MKGVVLSGGDLPKVAREIRSGIKRKIKEAGTRGAVVGLSGGIDSSVVATLTKNAGVNVIGLIMPETGVTKQRDIDDAIRLAEKLKIRYYVIELDRILTAVRNSFQWKDFPENRLKGWGNVKARERMVMLYLAANLSNRIVLGTGNKTELLLGYFTKYGDGGVDFLPIRGLYKTQVQQLAKYLKVDEKICCKVPTAGLWVGQTDEGELGLKYRQMDEILHCILDLELGVSETAKKAKVSESEVRKIKRKIGESAHKRAMPEIIHLKNL